MENLRKRLDKIGWNKREIEKAIGIIRKAKQNKTIENLFLEKRIFWILLIVLVAANFAVSIALIPLFITLTGLVLYFVIGMLGLIFGFSFELVIRTIEHLDRKHHLFLAILIPSIALLNVVLISSWTNDLMMNLDLKNIHFPVIIGFVYAASFALPYLIYRFVLKIEYYAKE